MARLTELNHNQLAARQSEHAQGSLGYVSQPNIQ
jgi:hypothetical protein